jgi:ribosomal protein S18 acetylase RimI-like enzyme
MTPSSSFHIRDAQQSDLRAIAQIHLEGWQLTYGSIIGPAQMAERSVEKRLPLWERWVKDPDNLILTGGERVDRVQGFLFGGHVKDHDFVSGSCDGFDCEIYSLHTLRKVQGKGLGRGLIAAAAERWQQRGRSALVLWAYRDNDYRRFYERLGGTMVAEGIDDGVPDVAYGWKDLPQLISACRKSSERPI